MHRLIPALLLPLVACVPVTDDDDSVDEDGVVDDDDLTDDDDSAPAWDASPPDVPDGTVLDGLLICGLFAEPQPKRWEKQGLRWEELEPPEHVLPLPEVMPCLAQSDKVLTWHEDGTLSFLAGGWTHTLDPAVAERSWLGEGEPVDRPSVACEEGLAALGLTLPVTFQLRLDPLR